MIHKVKYGYMEVVLESSLDTERAPDLTFKGAQSRVFAAFFAPYGTIEAEAMKNAYEDYWAPFEEEYSVKEAEEILRQEVAVDDAPL